jgi:hypothetical protein
MFNPLSRVCAALEVWQAVPALAMQKNRLERVAEGSAFATTIERSASRWRGAERLALWVCPAISGGCCRQGA